MPRWAEILGIVGVAVVVAFAILVIARLRTQSATQALDAPDPMLERARAIPSLPAGLLDVSVPAPLSARALDDATSEGIAAGSGAHAAPEPPPVAVPKAEPPSFDVAGSMGLTNVATPPEARAFPDATAIADASAPADLVEPPDVGEDVVDAGDAAETTDTRAIAPDTGTTAEPAAVAPGSREELALLKEAEAALAHLHSVRLRGDVPRQVVLDDAKRLEAILSKLPEGRRQELNALLDLGYRRLGTVEVGPDGVPTVRGTTAPGMDATDDRPVDLKGLSDRTRALERQLGLPPSAPVATRPAPTNPRALPAVEAAPMAPPPTPSAPSVAPSTLPSAQPSPL